MTATFVLRGAALGLAWFVLLNVAASAVVARVAGVLAGRCTSGSAAYWFGLRIFPAAIAATFVAAVFAP